MVKDLQLDLVEPSDEVTTAWLESELQAAKERLEAREAKIGDNDSSRKEADDFLTHRQEVTPIDRLVNLQDTIDALALSKAATEWAQACHPEDNNIFRDAQDCVSLAEMLCQFDSNSSLYKNLYEREYQPLHAFVRANLIQQLRYQLQQTGYPSAEACAVLLDHARIPTSPLTQCCEWLTKSQSSHHRVSHHTHQMTAPNSPWASGDTCDVLVEFLRPIVERVKFHFVTFDAHRAISTKIERLPEWLLSYLQKHVLEGKPTKSNANLDLSSPWELLTQGLAPYVTEEMPVLYLNELVGLVQYVLGERNFFRHAKVCGVESSPLVLCQAIENLLQFDDTLRNLLPMGQADRLLRCMDIFVAGDEELLAWWLEREKEMVFSTLFDNQQQGAAESDKAKGSSVVKTNISPRAELFCALIRSVQIKASVFSFSGPYLNAVAVPLCMQFLDAVHESTADLAKILKAPDCPPDALVANLEDWMAVLNGTHLAAAILTRENPWGQQSMAPSSSSSVHDLARFGRSLEQLQVVLLDEFATSFVESHLMERMKMASYFMRSLSHPTTDDVDDDENDNLGDEVSFDLKLALQSFHAFLQLCNECGSSNSDKGLEDDPQSFAIKYAPRAMKAKVIPLVTNLFLNFALDSHGLMGDILPEGGVCFARDVEAMFGRIDEGPDQVPSSVTRLMNVSKLMSMPAKLLVALQAALAGLVGGPEDPSRPWFLSGTQFAVDATLYEEAVSMLQAKGFTMELEDALSILNRRKDLRQGSSFTLARSM